MSQAEHPDRLTRDVTVDDVRQLMGASTPHFALQLRNRIARLIAGLPADHPARRLGEAEIARLTALGFSGETRGHHAEPGMRPLASVSDPGDPREPRVLGGPGSEDPEPHTTVA
ncbi:MAG: hypothetical protein QOK49_2685 [Baekduia sp.]|jgi:hypothetical protein|nr:hypothetical protein [Baekduia sp.]